MSETRQYLKIRRPDLGGSYTVPLGAAADTIVSEFDGAEPGDKIEVELVEMTEAEYEALPEFAGW